MTPLLLRPLKGSRMDYRLPWENREAKTRAGEK